MEIQQQEPTDYELKIERECHIEERGNDVFIITPLSDEMIQDMLPRKRPDILPSFIRIMPDHDLYHRTDFFIKDKGNYYEIVNNQDKEITRDFIVKYQDILSDIFLATDNIKYINYKDITPELCLFNMIATDNTLKNIPEEFHTDYLKRIEIYRNKETMKPIPDMMTNYSFYIYELMGNFLNTRTLPEEWMTIRVADNYIAQNSTHPLSEYYKNEHTCNTWMAYRNTDFQYMNDDMKTPERFELAVTYYPDTVDLLYSEKFNPAGKKYYSEKSNNVLIQQYPEQCNEIPQDQITKRMANTIAMFAPDKISYIPKNKRTPICYIQMIMAISRTMVIYAIVIALIILSLMHNH